MVRPNTRRCLDFIYVHGANGSGKSTLARTLLAYAGGVVRTERCKSGALVSYTHHALAFIGPYRTPTGGADSVHPYTLVPAAIHELLQGGYSVFCEGLITPGVETCKRIWIDTTRIGAGVGFIALDVPLSVCIEHVQTRRQRKGNNKVFDTSNVEKKHRSVKNWVPNLKAAGVPAAFATWNRALRHCAATFDLTIKEADPWS